jgi:hypothetical protein
MKINFKKRNKSKKNRGFVILFAVTISAILLSIALGVANISLQEIKFGTSAKDTNEAFFAADAGVECAFSNDKASGSVFVSPGSPSIACNGVSIATVENPESLWTFVVPTLGGESQGCARVTVDKTASPVTTVISKGYNVGDASCSSSNPDRIEREIRTTYSGGGVPSSPPSGPIVEDVVWENAQYVTITDNDIQKTSNGGAWNAGATSAQSIASGDGYVEFSTNESAGYGKHAGLGGNAAGWNYISIQFDINMAVSNNVRIFESGTLIGLFATYAAGDVFRIAIEGGVVKYYKNGGLLYTSLKDPTPYYPFYLDSSLYHLNGTVTDAKIFSSP